MAHDADPHTCCPLGFSADGSDVLIEPFTPKMATGVVRHPITGRYQPWAWSDDAKETTITYLRSYADYEDAAWVARQYAEAWRQHTQGGRPVLDRLVEGLRLGDVPDPLPLATEAALLHTIATQAEHPGATTLDALR